MIQPFAEQPGTPYISISTDTRVETHRGQDKRQPNFGDTIAGRPYLTANLQIPTTQERIDELYSEYYEILPSLTYREAMSLCRAFGCSYSTYLMRRYKHRKARLPEVVLVVNWYRAGKPVIASKHKLTVASLLFGD